MVKIQPALIIQIKNLNQNNYLKKKITEPNESKKSPTPAELKNSLAVSKKSPEPKKSLEPKQSPTKQISPKTKIRPVGVILLSDIINEIPPLEDIIEFDTTNGRHRVEAVGM